MLYEVHISEYDTVPLEQNWEQHKDKVAENIVDKLSSALKISASIKEKSVGILEVEIPTEQYTRYKLTTPIDEQMNLIDLDYMLTYGDSIPINEADDFLIVEHFEWRLEWKLIEH